MPKKPESKNDEPFMVFRFGPKGGYFYGPGAPEELRGKPMPRMIRVKPLNFIERALAGEVLEPDKEIYDAVDAWHDDPDAELSLHAYLGMTDEEYALWLEKPALLRTILASASVSRRNETTKGSPYRDRLDNASPGCIVSVGGETNEPGEPADERRGDPEGEGDDHGR